VPTTGMSSWWCPCAPRQLSGNQRRKAFPRESRIGISKCGCASAGRRGGPPRNNHHAPTSDANAVHDPKVTSIQDWNLEGEHAFEASTCRTLSDATPWLTVGCAAAPYGVNHLVDAAVCGQTP
jgi:hypothetical protein